MQFPESFLPARVSRAADQAMMSVLEEDALLREHGLTAGTKRSARRHGSRQAQR